MADIAPLGLPVLVGLGWGVGAVQDRQRQPQRLGAGRLAVLAVLAPGPRPPLAMLVFGERPHAESLTDDDRLGHLTRGRQERVQLLGGGDLLAHRSSSFVSVG